MRQIALAQNENFLLSALFSLYARLFADIPDQPHDQVRLGLGFGGRGRNGFEQGIVVHGRRAGGINEPDGKPMEKKEGFNGIPRRPGKRGRQGAVLAKDGIEKSRFTGIGGTDKNRPGWIIQVSPELPCFEEALQSLEEGGSSLLEGRAPRLDPREKIREKGLHGSAREVSQDESLLLALGGEKGAEKFVLEGPFPDEPAPGKKACAKGGEEIGHGQGRGGAPVTADLEAFLGLRRGTDQKNLVEDLLIRTDEPVCGAVRRRQSFPRRPSERPAKDPRGAGTP